MAAAQSDRDPPFALCAEFLNFSARDTASVSVSSRCRSRRLSPVLSLRHAHLSAAARRVSSCLRFGLFFGYMELMLMLSVLREHLDATNSCCECQRELTVEAQTADTVTSQRHVITVNCFNVFNVLDVRVNRPTD